MGTAELSCASLKALAEGLEVIAVVTQPDKPKGRHLKLLPTPVKVMAESLSIPVLQPSRARNEEFIEQLRALRPELIAVAAYGQILPAAILDLPPLGCLNVHTSLLPKYRGAAPIQWAILNGEEETGVTIMKMDVGLDTGAIVTQERTPIRPEDNAATLHDRLAEIGAELLVRTIPDYTGGKFLPQPQPAEGVSHAPKIKKEDGRIDWSKSAQWVWNRVRGLVPWPGAFTSMGGGEGQMLRIWEAQVVPGQGSPGEIMQAEKHGLVIACGEGAIRVVRLQREGGRQMTIQEFLAGHKLQPGDKLGAHAVAE